MYVVEVTSTPAVPGDRDTLGGWPVLDPDTPWPACPCGAPMVLFFQLDLPPDVAVLGGEHLLAFQCPQHNEACFPPDEQQLPPRYWDRPPPPNDFPFWRFLLQRAGVVSATADPVLQALRLTLEPGESDWAITVGGEPRWSQDPEHYRCSCGSDLVYLLGIPDSFGFPQQPGAPQQPDTFSAVEYCMFLGNSVYLLACPVRCDPAALWPMNQ